MKHEPVSKAPTDAILRCRGKKSWRVLALTLGLGAGVFGVGVDRGWAAEKKGDGNAGVAGKSADGAEKKESEQSDDDGGGWEIGLFGMRQHVTAESLASFYDLTYKRLNDREFELKGRGGRIVGKSQYDILIVNGLRYKIHFPVRSYKGKFYVSTFDVSGFIDLLFHPQNHLQPRPIRGIYLETPEGAKGTAIVEEKLVPLLEDSGYEVVPSDANFSWGLNVDGDEEREREELSSVVTVRLGGVSGDIGSKETATFFMSPAGSPRLGEERRDDDTSEEIVYSANLYDAENLLFATVIQRAINEGKLCERGTVVPQGGEDLRRAVTPVAEIVWGKDVDAERLAPAIVEAVGRFAGYVGNETRRKEVSSRFAHSPLRVAGAELALERTPEGKGGKTGDNAKGAAKLILRLDIGRPGQEPVRNINFFTEKPPAAPPEDTGPAPVSPATIPATETATSVVASTASPVAASSGPAPAARTPAVSRPASPVFIPPPAPVREPGRRPGSLFDAPVISDDPLPAFQPELELPPETAAAEPAEDASGEETEADVPTDDGAEIEAETESVSESIDDPEILVEAETGPLPESQSEGEVEESTSTAPQHAGQEQSGEGAEDESTVYAEPAAPGHEAPATEETSLADLPPIDPSLVEIQVFFFSQDSGDRIDLIDAPAPEVRWVSVIPDWSADRPEVLELRYEAPEHVLSEGERKGDRLGYVVRLVYDGKLQDHRAEPQGLLNQLWRFTPIFP